MIYLRTFHKRKSWKIPGHPEGTGCLSVAQVSVTILHPLSPLSLSLLTGTEECCAWLVACTSNTVPANEQTHKKLAYVLGPVLRYVQIPSTEANVCCKHASFKILRDFFILMVNPLSSSSYIHRVQQTVCENWKLKSESSNVHMCEFECTSD